MTMITKTAFAAVMLAAMAVSAHAQQGPTRQIQVLPAPGAVQQVAAAPAQDAAPIQRADAPPAEAAPAPEAAPQAEAAPAPAPAPAPKVAKVVKPEPKFVEVVHKPVHKVSYGYKRAPHCH